jgi:cell division protein FtsQ
MSSDFSCAAEKTGVKIKSSIKIEKGLRKLLIVAGIIFAAELIWLFGISPFIPFSTVDIQGFAGIENADVLKIAGIGETSSFMSTNVKTAQERLSNYILVESARVIKRFPDKLAIYLTPREAAAITLSSNGAKQEMICIDRLGVFFNTVNAGYVTSLPVISGIENPRLGMRLPESLVSLVENISVIEASSPELLSAISEIKIERKAWDGYELVLYPVHSSIKVRVENNLTEDVIRYMLLMLNVFESASPKPEEIDFRSGVGSYKIKEQL